MIKGKIDFDASVSIEPNAKVLMHVYMGEGACEPVLEDGEHLTDLIDNLFEAYIIPGTNKIADYHIEDAEMLIKELKVAVKHSKRRLKELS